MRKAPVFWQSLSGWAVLLLPLSWIFYAVIRSRKFLYDCGIKKIKRFSVPVIVVGNLTVGGTGKTPLVIAMAKIFREKGYRVGIVSRGVGGVKHKMPQWVEATSHPALVGDEAVLLVRRSGCPVVVCVDRVLAVETLLLKMHCDVVMSDDGLQHTRLGRDMEIVVVDGDRRFGNGYLLPAGPLREPISRLKKVDAIVVQGEPEKGEFKMSLEGETLVSLSNESRTQPISFFQGQTVHAVAAIGNPDRFFARLRAAGLHLIEHRFPDHYRYCEKDILFSDNFPILMTEKDAVKCFPFAKENMWYLRVEAKVDDELIGKGMAILERMK